MKCTDIQINDWVYLSEATKYPMQVDSIDRDHCYLNFEGNETDPFDGIYEEDGIAPIELTREIMKANGFCFIKSLSAVYDDYFYNEEMDILITADYIIRNDDIGDVKIKYVHECQHLLRFCGFDDSADNFKIR